MSGYSARTILGKMYSYVQRNEVPTDEAVASLTGRARIDALNAQAYAMRRVDAQRSFEQFSQNRVAAESLEPPYDAGATDALIGLGLAMQYLRDEGAQATLEEADRRATSEGRPVATFRTRGALLFEATSNVDIDKVMHYIGQLADAISRDMPESVLADSTHEILNALLLLGLTAPAFTLAALSVTKAENDGATPLSLGLEEVVVVTAIVAEEDDAALEWAHRYVDKAARHGSDYDRDVAALLLLIARHRAAEDIDLDELRRRLANPPGRHDVLHVTHGWLVAAEIELRIGNTEQARADLAEFYLRVPGGYHPDYNTIPNQLEALIADRTGDTATALNILRQASREQRRYLDSTRGAAMDAGRLVDLFARLSQREAERTQSLVRSLHGLSHDVRTPLTAITLAIDLIRPHLKGHHQEILDPLYSAVEGIVSSAEARTEVWELGTTELSENSVPLIQVVSDVVARLSLVASLREISIEVRDGRLPTTVPPSDVDTIVANLLDNALKYTPTGGSIVVCVDNVDGAPTVCVADSGPGLTGDYDPLFGTSHGRGLALVADLATLNGWRIDAASSTELGGAQFDLVLS